MSYLAQTRGSTPVILYSPECVDGAADIFVLRSKRCIKPDDVPFKAIHPVFDSWIFGPEAEYEVHGDVDDVVFPCGYTMDADGDTLNIYYGAADCAIALARASVSSLLDWLDANASSERRQRAQDL